MCYESIPPYGIDGMRRKRLHGPEGIVRERSSLKLRVSIDPQGGDGGTHCRTVPKGPARAIQPILSLGPSRGSPCQRPADREADTGDMEPEYRTRVP